MQGHLLGRDEPLATEGPFILPDRPAFGDEKLKKGEKDVMGSGKMLNC